MRGGSVGSVKVLGIDGVNSRFNGGEGPSVRCRVLRGGGEFVVWFKSFGL
jgi:hypothetical protein